MFYRERAYKNDYTFWMLNILVCIYASVIVLKSFYTIERKKEKEREQKPEDAKGASLVQERNNVRIMNTYKDSDLCD